MKQDQLFDFAGFSTNPAGVRKFRVGNGDVDARVALLTKQGHTGIDIKALSRPSTRADAKAEFGIDTIGITIGQIVTETVVDVNTQTEDA
jgi:hypothetical protein